jgi:phosphatidylserine/phosphatidylglycerophosphate/cardiolipin synthase-like enzyme
LPLHRTLRVDKLILFDHEEMIDARSQEATGSAAAAMLGSWGGRRDRALARTSDAPLREGNRLALLKNGPNTYDDWLAAIGRARHWVHLENYIFRADKVG